MADFLVRLDEKMWNDFVKDSAFDSGEEALQHLLTGALVQGDDALGITTKLVQATGKIRVLKVPSPSASDRIRAILTEPEVTKELGSGSYRLPS